MKSKTTPRPAWLFACLAAAAAFGLAAGASPAAAATCSLGPDGAIHHVVVLQFDNVHLERDNPNVPSDIEQMPALYDFLTGSGSLLANDHTVLISHTSDGIVSTETGLYPDRDGLNVGNTYPYLDPAQTANHFSTSVSVPGTNTSSSFKYWTDPTSLLTGDDNLYTLLGGPATPASPMGTNTPAPWAAFTRAGCDFAGIGAADMELENTQNDIFDTYGGNGQTTTGAAGLGNYSYNTAYAQHFSAGANLAGADFEGLAIHCSAADSTGSGLCAANGGLPDALPSEPGGYIGYKALFGAQQIDPVLTGRPNQPVPAGYTPAGDTPPPAGNWLTPPVYDVFAPNATNAGGNEPVATHPANSSLPPTTYSPGSTPTSQVLDSTGNPGFPGFNGMEANNALGYTAAALEAGIPVTYTYLSDVHDDQYDLNHGNAYGPGEAGMEQQIAAYNAAFAAFFHRLAADGINKSNTVFLVTVDEGDHYDGGPPLNAGCDGVTVACQYDTAEAGGAAYGTPGYKRDVGEIDVNLPQLVSSGLGDPTTFGFDGDDAPAIVVPNQSSPTGPRPGPQDPAVRGLEQALGGASIFNPIDGTTDPLMVNEADETEEQILHEVDSDPNRVPTFTLFGDPTFYNQGVCAKVGPANGGPAQIVTNEGPACPAQGLGFAWNHGDDQPEIASTWQGWVGPGIQNLGRTSSVWTDHPDARATLLTLLGLSDDYTWDGRAVDQILGPDNLPPGASGLPRDIALDRFGYEQLASAYKQLDAPFGEFGLATLDADTHALASQTPGDAFDVGMTAQLQACEAQRAALVPQIQSILAAAEHNVAPVYPTALPLLLRADALIADAELLKSARSAPARPVCGGSLLTGGLLGGLLGWLGP